MRQPIEEREYRSLFVPPASIDGEPRIIVHYRMVPTQGLTLEQAAARVSMITTVRTMRQLPFETRKIRREQVGLIISTQDTGQVEIAYPLEICTQGEGLTQLFTIIAAGAEYNYTDALWVDSIELPAEFVDRYQGPRFGIRGIRNLFNIHERAIVGVSVKPRVGVPVQQIADICRASLIGGLDFVVDDMFLVDPPGEMSFANRVATFVKVVGEARSRTGESKRYFANISAAPFRANRFASIAMSEGVDGLVINAHAMGFDGVDEMLRLGNITLPIITTNMGSGMLSRQTRVNGTLLSSGISEVVTSAISRLVGADGVHAGTSSSECFGNDAWGPATQTLNTPWRHLDMCFAVAEGDLTIANVWDNIRSLGPDVMMEVASGIYSYPGGAERAGSSFRLLAENLASHMSPEEAHERIINLAEKNRHLKSGLEYFGYSPSEL